MRAEGPPSQGANGWSMPTRSRLDEAQELERRGDHRGAAAVLREHLASQPDDVEAWYLLAELGIDSFRPDDSLAACRSGSQLAPGDPRFPMVEADAWLHRVTLRLASPEEALPRAREALARCGSREPEVLVVEAGLRLLEGDRAEARRLFEASLEGDTPLEVDVLEVELNLVLLDLLEGRRQEARRRAERLWHLLEEWDEEHFYRFIPFHEYLALAWSHEFGEEPPTRVVLPEEVLDEGFRDMEGYRRIRLGLRGVREAATPDARRAAAAELLDFLESPDRRLCVMFSTVKGPYLVRALREIAL